MPLLLVFTMVIAVIVGGAGSAESAQVTPPNIVLIVVDDLTADELEIGFNRRLPGRSSALETLLIDQGATFPNFFNTTPLCCPSRASYLTGQYAHNHLVWGNNALSSEPRGNGGHTRFYNDERDLTSIGAWMGAAGYETVLVGKYLNGYPDHQGLQDQGVTAEYVPRGWDEWYGTFTNDRPFSYFDFRINHNGIVVDYPDSYMTDVEKDLAVGYVTRRAGDVPFFLYLAPFAPHGPTQPREDHRGMHSRNGVEPGPTPACDEADLSDKPSYIRDEPSLVDHAGCWNVVAQEKLDMTLAIDELIAEVVAALDARGVLDNTYIFFTSDNGGLRGEHHIGGKSAPYEESIRVPMIVRGPGVPPGVTMDHLTLNIDFAPTALDLAGGAITPGSPPMDGESLVPAMTGALAADDWRSAVLIELRTRTRSTAQPHEVPTYSAVRTADHIYVEFDGGDRELYDLVADPHQLDSAHRTAAPATIGSFRAMLNRLRNCVGAECAQAARATGVYPLAALAYACIELGCAFDANGGLTRIGLPLGVRFN